MVHRALPLAALLVLLPFAGCLSDEAPAAGEEPTAAAGDAATTSDLPSDMATNGTGRVVPVSLAGSLPTYVATCVYAVVAGACQYVPPGGTYNNHVEVSDTGNLTSGTLTLTWTASSALTEEMYVVFYGFNDEDFNEIGFVMGPSPLELTVDKSVLDASMEHHIYVGIPSQGIGALVAGASARAATEQTFTLEGALLFEQ